MKRIDHVKLRAIVKQIFARLGSHDAEAIQISDCLVESNLAGHDSHGVIRVPIYAEYVANDRVRPNQTIQIVHQTDSLAIVDGQYGFGQVIGRQAMKLGIEMASQQGVAAVALRNSGHLGRIGDWPQLVAQAGMASFHFVNTNGFGLLVAPYGGIDRRLSANPIAAGFPLEGADPMILDISTCAIAEGKLKVARNRGDQAPENCIIDSDGNSTTDPNDFYNEPRGALLPFGGHKGYGLGMMAEMFAGALTGNGCTNPENDQRLLNGMFSLIVDPSQLAGLFDVQAEAKRFVAYVKSARRIDPAVEIMVPGELEDRTRRQRIEHGIEIDDASWQSIASCANDLGVDVNV